MSISIGSHYGMDREIVIKIHAVAARVNAQNSTVSATPFGHRYTVNRWSVQACDAMAAAIAAADGKTPNKLFNSRWNFGRAHCADLVALEARVTALGW